MRKRVSIFCCVILLVFAAGAEAQTAQSPDACAQISEACQKAGFVRGGAGNGTGLMADCVRPILAGSTAQSKASKPLPQVDPQLVAACRAANPAVGRGNGRTARRQGVGGESSGTPPAQPSAVASAHPAAAGSPNIVFILTDDLAINLVQFMPHVLAMQKNGTTFSNYFVTDSLCCPSRSSIFTGRYPHDTGVFTNSSTDGGYLVFKSRGNEQATFAVALARSGYRTAFLGKYLNGYQPNRYAGGPGWTHWVGAGNGYPEFNYALNEDGKLTSHGHAPEDYLTDVVSANAVAFIKQKPDTPFFVEVATFAPHAPYTPAPRDANAFPDLRAPRTAAYNAPHDDAAPSWLKPNPPLTQADMDGIDRDFRKRAQSVQAVDKMIGDLQAAVAAIGQEKNTYFVFSSDNGYHMGEYRLRQGKMTAYDTDINVPLVITGPKVPAGAKIEEIVENVDLAPTFADLAGATPMQNPDGVSLVNLLRGQQPQGWRAVALVEHHGPVRDAQDPDMPPRRSGNPTTYEAIRSRNSLYVEYANGEKEYHDLTTDPNELRNTFSALSADQKAALHKMLSDTQSCHSAKDCWAAQGGKGSPGGK